MKERNLSISNYCNRRMAVMLLLGFSSGLPLALSGSTLQAWLTVSGVDIRSIGMFALVGLPYTLKFLWSPMMDRFVPLGLGRRRDWMLLSQLGLVACLILMAFSSPESDLMIIGILALILAFLSASQDIAIDAYRADILKSKERGLGAALSVNGYRLAMLASGAVALILSEQIGWSYTYLCMAGLMLVGIITSWFSPQPEQIAEPATLTEAIVQPFVEFLQRPSAWMLLLMIVLYKLGDAFAGTLTTTFLIRGLDFTLTDVGVVSKGMGLLATLFGALVGGTLLMRLGIYRSLLIFGVLQAITNLGFLALTYIGKSYLGLMLVIGCENLAGGMGTAAFVALLMSLCNHRYTATQFALLSSLAAIGRVLVGPSTGILVEWCDWNGFFLLSFFVALPGLVMVYFLRTQLREYEYDK